MKRGQPHHEEREEQSPPARHTATHHGYFGQPGAIPEDRQRHVYQTGLPPLGKSPLQSISSPGSALLGAHSPPTRPTIPPSPSPPLFLTATAHPSLSPPIAPAHFSPQTVHLHALQHDISVKALALQTLQHEHTTLLRTLERQRTRYATLEQKLRISDVEINTLSDEKDRLVGQVSTLENRVEELQQSRDEARSQLFANGAQYMRIMEMGNRLQAQGAADAKTWGAEKEALERRIRLLAGATEHTSLGEGECVSAVSNSNSSQTETITVLRAEVSRLRAKMQVLEQAMQSVEKENEVVKGAARQIVEVSGVLDGIVAVVGEMGSVGEGC